MDIRIHFNQEPKQDRSRLYNRLAKATTALSIPMLIWGAHLGGKDMPDASPLDVLTSNIFKYSSPTQFGILGSIILSSAGLILRRQYIIEKNAQPQYVTNVDKMAELRTAINGEKAKCFQDNESDFDKAVNENGYVPFPSITDDSKLYPLLMMNNAEMEQLPPLAKCTAYIAQIKCMNYFIQRESGGTISHGYTPDIPPAEMSDKGQALYRYQDMLRTLQTDYNLAAAKLAEHLPDGIRLEISETLQKSLIHSDAGKHVRVHSATTAFLMIFAPAIPATYTAIQAIHHNLVMDVPMLTDDGQTENILHDLERNVRRICGTPGHSTSSASRYKNYRNVTGYMTTDSYSYPSLQNI